METVNAKLPLEKLKEEDDYPFIEMKSLIIIHKINNIDSNKYFNK